MRQKVRQEPLVSNFCITLPQKLVNVVVPAIIRDDDKMTNGIFVQSQRFLCCLKQKQILNEIGSFGWTTSLKVMLADRIF